MVRRVPYLDGLRAMAILSVVLYHAVRHNPSLGAHPYSPWGFVLRQGHGVELFFVLSGFCLAYPALARLHYDGITTVDLARFSVRRFIRIMPPFWIALCVLWALLALQLHFHLHPSGSMPEHAVAWPKLAEQAMLFNLRPVWLNGSFWTLPIEAHWYLLFPVLLWVWTRSVRAFSILGAACWVAFSMTRFQAPDVLALPAFMLGIVAADIRVRGNPLARYAAPAFVLFAAIAVIASYGTPYPAPSPWWELTMFALVVAAGEVAWLGRLLSARVFAPIAAASYSIYLLHQPIVGTVEQYMPKGTSVAMTLAISGMCGVAAGLVFSYIAERPFRKGPVRDWLTRELDARMPGLLEHMGIAPKMTLPSSLPERPGELVPLVQVTNESRAAF